MSAYINALNASVEAEERKYAEAVHDTNKQARERLTSLESRVEKLLSTIPLEVQREGMSLQSLQAQLKGRWIGDCHPGELGAALRRMGYRRVRRWRGDDKVFRALWFPSNEPALNLASV